MKQLSLPLAFAMEYDFPHFYAGERNAQLLATLGSVCQRRLLAPLAANTHFYCGLIWSSQCTGKSHLLQACCVAADQFGLRASYVPLTQAQDFSPSVFENIAHSDLIAIDDLQMVVGDETWEEAIFHAYNQIQEQGKVLLLSSGQSLSSVEIKLPDLSSRLRAGDIYQVYGLTDEEKVAAFLLRAKMRGIIISAEVARFMLSRVPRDWPSLIAALDQLDQATIQQKRKVTIPLVKEILVI